jgi:hypothetical protein
MPMSGGASSRRALIGLLFTWMLVYSRHGTDWHGIDQFEFSSHCEQSRAARIDRETCDSIGALADQPADNPLRRVAYVRAERHVEARYRCAETR